MAGNICQNIFKNTSLLVHLKSQNFDIGLAEPNFICSFALFEHLQIAKTISIDSSPTRSFLHPAPIKNSFLERAQTLLETYFNHRKIHRKFGVELAELPIEVSDWRQLIGKIACFFVNSDRFLDFFEGFRSARIVEVGGIGVDFQGEQKIEKNSTQNRILINFGSFAPNLPLKINQSLTKIIKNHQKYAHFENYLVVTHGSIKMLQNLAHSGLAALIIPLDDEQLRAAQLFQKHGSSLILTRKNAEKIEEKIREILENPNYHSNARILSTRLRDRPENPKIKFLAYFKFVAQYDDINLEPLNLSFCQQHNFDIFAAFLITVAITVVVVRWLLVQFKTRKVKTM